MLYVLIEFYFLNVSEWQINLILREYNLRSVFIFLFLTIRIKLIIGFEATQGYGIQYNAHENILREVSWKDDYL